MKVPAFSSTALALLQRATELVSRIPDEPGIRSHELTRAVRVMLDGPAIIQDGWYASFEHSWLWIDGDVILDLCAVGRYPQVQLVRASPETGHYQGGGLSPSLYRESRPRQDIDHEIVALLVQYMQRGEATLPVLAPAAPAEKAPEALLGAAAEPFEPTLAPEAVALAPVDAPSSSEGAVLDDIPPEFIETTPLEPEPPTPLGPEAPPAFPGYFLGAFREQSPAAQVDGISFESLLEAPLPADVQPSKPAVVPEPSTTQAVLVSGPSEPLRPPPGRSVPQTTALWQFGDLKGSDRQAQDSDSASSTVVPAAALELARRAALDAPIRKQAEAEDALEVLSGLVTELQDCVSLSKPLQQALMGIASSLARHLQDELGEVAGARWLPLTPTIDGCFRTMTRWSATYEPGYVPGLNRKNRPITGSWHTDTQHWFRQLTEHATTAETTEARPTPEQALTQLGELLQRKPSSEALLAQVRLALDVGVAQRDPRLVKLLVPHLETVLGAHGLKTLKSALKVAAKTTAPVLAEEAEEEDEGDQLVPENWPYLELTKGKRALIAGGEARSSAIARIEECFQFSEVTWTPTDVRLVQAAARQIRNGKVDVVILLCGLLEHRTNDALKDAAKESGALVVLVPRGYGVVRIRRAIEHGQDSTAGAA